MLRPPGTGRECGAAAMGAGISASMMPTRSYRDAAEVIAVRVCARLFTRFGATRAGAARSAGGNAGGAVSWWPRPGRRGQQVSTGSAAVRQTS
jgi:hypothetical protein